jgi:hypothetical protein
MRNATVTRKSIAGARAVAGVRALALALLAVVAVCLAASPASASPEPFGPEAFGAYAFGVSPEDQGGSPSVQAGSHPYALTTEIVFNHTVTGVAEQYRENLACILEEPGCENRPLGNPVLTADIYGSPKHIEVSFPRGMVINPNATSVKCTESQLETSELAGGGCPAASAVGINIPSISALLPPSAVYNMVPPPGEPGELGVNPAGVGLIFHVTGRVRTGGDYGITGEVANLTQKVSVFGDKIVLWGDPTAESHDSERDICATRWKVDKEIEEEFVNAGYGRFIGPPRYDCPLAPSERTGEPLLTMPSSCTGSALESTLDAESWQEPGHSIAPPSANTRATSPAVTGCEKLRFDPSLDVRPSPGGVGAESPSGLSVDLKFPLRETEGLAEANLKKAVVALPAGFAISPSAADGLGACTPAQIGLHDAEKPSCPDSSKVGVVEVFSPLLERPLTGAVYLAQQGTFEGALIGLYIVVEGQGALVKLGGTVALDPNTGQITTTFDNNPQLPFSELKLMFFAGQRAPLVTPSSCGAYAASAQLTPWSGGSPAEPALAGFSIEQGCDHPFGPSFMAGTDSLQAAGYTPFSLTLARQDGEQRLGSIRVQMPAGLLANIKSVERCPEPQAASGECAPGSLIGESTASAGPGSDPFWARGGRVYLTGPYGGAPFGLSIVVPAVAGPFDLGNVIARAAVNVDSHTGQVSVTGALPTIKDGIPLDVRTVNVTINRQGFMFNPTNCTPTAVTATVESTSGASAGVSSPFDVANCASLGFHPSFTASTQASTSKKNGASLTVKVGYPTGAQANIRSTAVVLPKQLPARLTTIQQACPEAVFNANPASCPAGSNIGTATATTPVLAGALSGPAYLVSHGGAAFPDVTLVLQGEGITLVLVGSVDIKHGITSSTFASIPDAPISSFELKLPEGPHSGLAAVLPAKAKGNLCGTSLTMPTVITGQNGAQIKQNTKIAVAGCTKAKPAKKKAKKRKKKGK